MTRIATRSRFLAPLVYVAALVLLLEEWCWNVGLRFFRALARWPFIAWLEERVRALPPYAALCAFVLPGLLLFPVKLFALWAIAKGHAASGVTCFVVAKLGGAAVVARLYALTLPTLLAVGWFARCHGSFMRVKDRWIAYLRASAAYTSAGRMLRTARLNWRRLRRRMRSRTAGRREASRLARTLRRFIVQWRARRR
jgi:hypothetical protein